MTLPIDNLVDNDENSLASEEEYPAELPVKKKTNYAILLIPAIFVFGAAAFVGMKVMGVNGKDQSQNAGITMPASGNNQGFAGVNQQLQQAKLPQQVVGGETIGADASVASAVTANSAVSSVQQAPQQPVAAPMPVTSIGSAPAANQVNENFPAAIQNTKSAPVAATAASNSNGAVEGQKSNDVARLQQANDEILKLQTELKAANQQIDTLKREKEELLKKEKSTVASKSPNPPVTKPAPAHAVKAAPVAKATTSSAATPKPVPAPDIKTTQRNDYVVYAIVDGRAWITSVADKVSHPVANGETLPDGSTILSMDEGKFEVKTSKGIVRDAARQKIVRSE